MAPDGSSLTELADRIAEQAHAGQRDKAGAPYIAHPRRVAWLVAQRGGSIQQQAVALLHDVLEDTAITASQLRQRGIPDDVIDAVVALTKRPGESHADAVLRAAAHPVARLVKQCDIDDNRDPQRLARLDAHTRRRLEGKYQAATELLAANGDGPV